MVQNSAVQSVLFIAEKCPPLCSSGGHSGPCDALSAYTYIKRKTYFQYINFNRWRVSNEHGQLIISIYMSLLYVALGFVRTLGLAKQPQLAITAATDAFVTKDREDSYIFSTLRNPIEPY
jgi:hypothetical protein